jgi:hypothetical protein
MQFHAFTKPFKDPGAGGKAVSAWTGRRIWTDGGESGEIIPLETIGDLSRAQLIDLILAKDLQLVRWNNGNLELIAEWYLAEPGTHVAGYEPMTALPGR